MACKVYHFHNGKGGGVLSVIRNLLAYRQDQSMAHHVIYTINTDCSDEFVLPNLPGAASETVFYYSADWNFYHTCRELAKCLPGGDAVLVAHDWLELGMCSLLGLPNPVVQFLHGDYPYYYQLASRHAVTIDKFVCVAASIEQTMKNKLPEKSKDVLYCRFPVPDVPGIAQIGPQLNLAFIGRCEAGKGYPLLPKIAECLQEKGIEATWHIFGAITPDIKQAVKWQDEKRVRFYGELPQDKMLEKLKNHQLLVLPSLAEGMPLSVIEAMKAGLVPLVNDIPGGLQELVVDGETGYKIKDNEVAAYVDRIIAISNNPEHWNMLSQKAQEQANKLFDPVKNTGTFECLINELFLQAGNRRPKPAKKTYGSRLDEAYIPNFVTKYIRSLK